MRELAVRRDTSISRLAWAARVPSKGQVNAIVGPWVESSDRCIVEGCWKGDFDSGDFDTSYSFMGSGLIVRGDDVVVVAPCNTTEAIYSLQHGDDMIFSDSLALLLKVGDARLDPAYLDYEADALSISGGLDEYKRTIRLAGDRTAGVHYFCNVEVTAEGELKEHKKPEAPAFETYSDYRLFLSNEVRGIFENGRARSRSRKYRPIVFCSSGYDSSACAALGGEAGCTEAVVFESKKNVRVDSGKAVVEALGYEIIHEMNELDYLQHDCAHLFLGTGELGTSVFFAAAEKELTGKLLLSGVHGDKIWDRNGLATNPTVVRSYYPDTARKEFRLATGYLNVPIPFLAVARHEDLHRISNSDEMSSWQLDNEYDRPIPRRILEELGVPRDAFGQEKDGGAGSSMRFGNLWMLGKVMPSGSYSDFRNWLKRDATRRPLSAERIKRSAAYVAYLGVTFLALHGVAQPAKVLRFEERDRKISCSPFAPSHLFDWAVGELQRRQYASATL